MAACRVSTDMRSDVRCRVGTLAHSTGSHSRLTDTGVPTIFSQNTHRVDNLVHNLPVCNRSGIYTHSDEQAAVAKQHLEKLNAELGVRAMPAVMHESIVWFDGGSQTSCGTSVELMSNS